MSLLRNLTGITTPASTDLFYVVQNNTDYKMTSEQFMNFAKSAIVVSLTQAQYDALTPAEKSNGSIYLINDATLSASDIAYGQGTVEDSLDELTNVENITITTTANVTSVDYSVRKIGRVVFYYISFQVVGTYTATGTQLFTGLPIPSKTLQIPVIPLGNTYPTQMAITTAGRVETRYTNVNNIPNNSYILLSGMYIV